MEQLQLWYPNQLRYVEQLTQGTYDNNGTQNSCNQGTWTDYSQFTENKKCNRST